MYMSVRAAADIYVCIAINIPQPQRAQQHRQLASHLPEAVRNLGGYSAESNSQGEDGDDGEDLPLLGCTVS